MEDLYDPYEFEEDTMGENIEVGNVVTWSNGCKNQETPLDISKTMRSLKVEIQICKQDNGRLIKAQ